MSLFIYECFICEVKSWRDSTPVKLFTLRPFYLPNQNTNPLNLTKWQWQCLNLKDRLVSTKFGIICYNPQIIYREYVPFHPCLSSISAVPILQQLINQPLSWIHVMISEHLYMNNIPEIATLDAKCSERLSGLL